MARSVRDGTLPAVSSNRTGVSLQRGAGHEDLSAKSCRLHEDDAGGRLVEHRQAARPPLARTEEVTMEVLKVPCVDLKAQYHLLKGEMDQSLIEVLEGGGFVLG